MLGTKDTEQPVDVYSVSDLNLAVRAILDEAFDTLWIKGEISNFASPRSGHWYFTLKDSKAQIKCAMFRGANWKVGFQPENGMEVILNAKVSLYPERGDYQLICEQMQVSGEGQLQKAYEQLKKKLEKEGLFKASAKKPFPAYPRKIAVVTSPTGAALQDILSVLERRYPVLEVDVIPAMVQGQAAAASIVKALKRANQKSDYDLIILARGGGSLEDLWPFNEEQVALAIYRSNLPIISGVGHETDFTIADYVADLRAPTPSVAAETVTPNAQDLEALFYQYQEDMFKLMLRRLNDLSQRVDSLDKRLVSPAKVLKQHHSSLAQLARRLDRGIEACITSQRHTLLQVLYGLNLDSFHQHLLGHKKQLHSLIKQQQKGVLRRLDASKNQAKQSMRSLHALSPLATLDRGYTITRVDNKVVTDAKSVSKGQLLESQFKDGRIQSVVQEVLINS